ERIDPSQNRDRGLDRRTVIKRGLLAGGLIAGAGGAIAAAAGLTDEGSSTPTAHAPRPAAPAPKQAPRQSSRQTKPNILVILVDQLRFPQWFSPNPAGLVLPPNLQGLREGAVSFARHYTASNDCSPSRSALLTGLYTHQTGCMITGGSTLDPGFPTWGSMLREHGYSTRWFGKWHLTHGDNHWTQLSGEQGLELYGYAGGVYPSPDGAPGQGWRVDGHIASTFEEWFAEEGGSEPWHTAVSFVNPHDIAWWYKWTDRVPAEVGAPQRVGRLPANYETPEQLMARRKPQLQLSFQETAASSFGPVPFTGPEATGRWLEFLDLYVKLQLEVDRHVGRVLRTLESRPEVAANTVIVFTSDHGEYGASHGMRGKGASAYEECTRVPLLVKDPRGILTAEPQIQRTQLTSSVDVAPLLLTIATGSEEWRGEPRYSHIAGRADLAAILADPRAPGRAYVLHATDETVTEYSVEPYAASAPLHIVALRTARAKFATYTNWAEGGITPISSGEEAELYDYGTQKGRLELENGAGHSPLEAGLRIEHERAFLDELREPLPTHLSQAHTGGFADYFRTARHVAVAAAASRKRHEERELGEGVPPDSLLFGHRGRRPRLPLQLRSGPLRRGSP
ncbi:MAG TPA: sulfatase-like hydrolase/transferase, partial [Solirubrobacteraceae bacterium]|nr:sulfatase-like hydrolase/transferase [Solirubrobacteraceae bacterium]